MNREDRVRCFRLASLFLSVASFVRERSFGGRGFARTT